MTQNERPAPAAPLYNRAAGALLLALLALRLVTAARFGLAWDEAYYWQWSRHVALCYYDAGPGIALCIRAGTIPFGDTPFGVRFVPIVLSVAANTLLFATARRWFDARVAWWTLVLAAASPLLAIGSVLATYDLPQVFFWAAGLYCVTRAVQKNTPAWWYATGLCVGLGTLTKPTMIFFAPGALLLLALVPAYRKHLQSPHPYLAFALALVCLAPMFVWNAQHGNLNWIHTLNRGNRDTGAAPGRWLGDFWGGQLLVTGPFVLLAELAALWAAARRWQEPRNAFVLAFAAPLLLVCTVLSVRSKVEINWPVAAHLSALVGVGAQFAAQTASRATRTFRAVAVTTSALVTYVLFLPNVLLLRPFGPFRSNGTWEKVNELYGWQTIAAAIARERAALAAADPKTPIFYAGTGYRVCSVMAFYLPGQPRVEKLQIPGTRRDQYELWTNEVALAGQNAVVAIDQERPEEAAYLRTRFVKMSAPTLVHVTRRGFLGDVKTWYVYRCRGFVPLVPPR